MKTLNGQTFKSMILSGCNALSRRYPEIDALNVFPVPDGDTGTNMYLTFSSGAKDILDMDHAPIGEVAKKLSRGLLMGARGNSGVILSQIFRGVAMSLENKKTIGVMGLSKALSKGAEVAYKAVMRPVEGTILTVVREASEDLASYVHKDMEIEDAFAYFVQRAEQSLQHTPELLPVLKEVGVVDSGGAGFCVIMNGFIEGLYNEVTTLSDAEDKPASDRSRLADVNAEDEAGYGYCTEFILRLDPRKRRSFTIDRLKKELSNLPGESIVVVQDEDIVKVHVHTLKPGNALNLAQRFGEFIKIKIENMEEQHHHILEEKNSASQPHKNIALIAVAAGEGIKDMFLELRVDHVVNGGQTMNPSTEDIVAAIRDVHADHVIVLPNNSNIIMAAQQAAVVLEDEVNVIVIPSKSIPEGLSACVMYNPEAELSATIQDMNEAIKHVKTGQITFAIKDTNIDGVDIRANDYMALVDRKIVGCTQDKMEACRIALQHMITPDDEIVTLIGGEDVSDEQLKEISAFIKDNYEVEVDEKNGRQPVYSFILGVE